MKTQGCSLISSIIVLFTSLSAPGQDSLPPQRFLTVQHDNDYLHLAWQGTDRYYTAGNIISYSFLQQHNNGLMSRMLLSPRKQAPSFMSIGVTQWMFSPDDLRAPGVVKGDYPYAGVLFLRLSREKVLSPRRLFRSELWLGVLGPSSLAKPAQSLAHRILGDELPKGWNFQLPDYPVFNYTVYAEGNMFSFGPKVRLNGWIQAQAGTLLNNAETGLHFTFSSRKNDYFPRRLYALNRREIAKGWKFYAEFTPSVRFVAANAILQGNTFHDWFGKKPDYYIDRRDLKNVLWKWSGTLGIRRNRLMLQYTQAWQSREFRTVHAHTYGSLRITVRL